MLPLALADAIGEAIAFVVVLVLLLGACILAAVLLLVAYGLRVSTDATVAGTAAGLLAFAVTLGLGFEAFSLLVALAAGVGGFVAGRYVRGTTRRDPFQGAGYGLVLAVLAIVGFVSTAAFWTFLLGQSTDVVGAMLEHPDEGTLLVVLSGAPTALGVFVLVRLGRLPWLQR